MKNSISQFVYGVVAVFIFGLVSCPVMGQVATKIPLTEKDYPLWGVLQTHAISDNGNWVSYTMHYESKTDTLFAMNTKTNQKFVLPNGWDSKLVKDNTFAYRKQDTLIVLNLDSGKQNQLSGIKEYGISADGNYIITLEKTPTEGKKLCIRDNQGKLEETFYGIGKYEWNDAKNKILFTTAEHSASVKIVDLKSKPQTRTLFQSQNEIFSSLSWQKNGNDVVFYSKSSKPDAQTKVIYYDGSQNKVYTIANTNAGFPKEYEIDSNTNVRLQISNDGSKVFFGMRSTVPKIDKENFEGVEIWNTNDKVLYTERKLIASVGNKQLVAAWWPKTGIIKPITSEEESWMMLTGDQQYAITANPLQYEPQYKLFADRDYYLTQLATGNKIKFLEKQSGQEEMIRVSPGGKYITYFREGNWWMYNIVKRTHVNLTKDLVADWDNSKIDPGAEQHVWGLAGWTSDNKAVLYYDYYDIWCISTDGKKREKLTSGRETNMRFRWDESERKALHNHSGFTNFYIDLTKNNRLIALNLSDGSLGYYGRSPDKKSIPLVMKSGASTQLIKAKNSEAFVYETQKFDNPPTILFRENNRVKDKILFQSNPQHFRYEWGASKMIHYNAPTGRELNGALFYPAGYDETQKYPMIVWIYDTVSRDVNKYVNPTLKNTLGYNIANLTSKGYFVLLADIAFEKGNPGKSAVDCVTAAVNKVVDMGCTEIGKIGLLGHSFGGYETNYIITQTNLFSAAVSGAGVSDTMGHYFTISTEDNAVEAWRYENQQYRMGKSFFEDRGAYFDNSPLEQAAKIRTPLLTWAGLLDENVQPKQAATFYVALRRLNKKNIMLRYPDEGHIFYKPNNQIDLTNRIQQWFDHFLKKEPAPQWIRNGVE